MPNLDAGNGSRIGRIGHQTLKHVAEGTETGRLGREGALRTGAEVLAFKDGSKEGVAGVVVGSRHDRHEVKGATIELLLANAEGEASTSLAGLYGKDGLAREDEAESLGVGVEKVSVSGVHGVFLRCWGNDLSYKRG